MSFILKNLGTIFEISSAQHHQYMYVIIIELLQQWFSIEMASRLMHKHIKLSLMYLVLIHSFSFSPVLIQHYYFFSIYSLNVLISLPECENYLSSFYFISFFFQFNIILLHELIQKRFKWIFNEVDTFEVHNNPIKEFFYFDCSVWSYDCFWQQIIINQIRSMFTYLVSMCYVLCIVYSLYSLLITFFHFNFVRIG